MLPGNVQTDAMVIGVCTHNRGPAIVQTLRALVSLDCAGGRLRRIVVVDNGSTDSTPAHVAAFIADRVGGIPLTLHSESRPGKRAAIQRLFSETVEPIVGIVDDDIVPRSDWAVALLRRLDACPQAGVVGGRVWNRWESGPTYLARLYHRSLGDQDLGQTPRRLDHPLSFLMGAAVAVRRSAVEASRWLQTAMLDCRRGAQMVCGEDAEMCLRLRQSGWDVWYEPHAVAEHLIPPWRQTTTYLARLRESIAYSEPWLHLIARGDATTEWACRNCRRARFLYWRTLLTDWRPRRRRIRLGERRGRYRAWHQIAARLKAGER